MDIDIESDDDIVGEAIYDEEYLRKRKQRKMCSSSEGDEEYRMDEEYADEEEEGDSLSMSDDMDEPPKLKKLLGRPKMETKLRSVRVIGPGLRQSKRTTRSHINYGQYEHLESDNRDAKPQKWKTSIKHSEASESPEYSNVCHNSGDNYEEEEEPRAERSVQRFTLMFQKESGNPTEKDKGPSQEDGEGDGGKKVFWT
ncbi:hypothetical protein SAY86_003568 [Trapa natans]|uniref:Uncharacterized protein n=1 Tax=Trapa natans TaxID=22666 RepID=A0AAN7N1Y6_TRANT|nr:hypothetical protein SAY86_003568 [Trapa natans]